jgi:hypothetical protein
MSKKPVAKSAKKKSSDAFVPDEVESSGPNSYFKPEDGSNKVRVLSKPIVGWLAWGEDEDGKKKPIRSQIDDQPNMEDYEEDNQPKKFMAVAVLDHADDEVKIWEMTQQSVIKAIKALSGNPDWGNPFSYDLNINKTGEKLKTKYSVTPSPKKPLAKELVKVAMSKPCNLDALYEGADPWDVDGSEVTEYEFK